jgi:hypothetical protein
MPPQAGINELSFRSGSVTSPSPYRYFDALQTVIGKPREELLRLLCDRNEDLVRRTAVFMLLTGGNADRVRPLLLALDDPDLCNHSLFVLGCAHSLGRAERRHQLTSDEQLAFAAAKPRISNWLLALLDLGSDWTFAASNALATYRDERLIRIPIRISALLLALSQTAHHAVSLPGRWLCMCDRGCRWRN